ncbi:MAG TPA: WecB/TagA/CpsF family glycosyltransferase [Sphingomicrobium sp.]|nr:WecB/TagA/CpsF family glycosyltransferase [Sphingomicrobium sp.]
MTHSFAPRAPSRRILERAPKRRSAAGKGGDPLTARRGSRRKSSQQTTADLEGITIVHVVRQFHPGVGGLENFVGELARRQAGLGHEVRVVTLDRIFSDPSVTSLPRGERLGDIEIIRVPFVGSARYPIAPGALNAIRGADIVHVHGVDFFCDFLAATAFIHQKPLILSTHGGFFHTSFLKRFKKLYFNLVTRGSLSQFAAVVACSEEDRRTFERIAGERLTLIPNPVDIEKFAGLANPCAQTLIYFGRLAPNKELHRLIGWFEGLAARGDWRLIIAGKPMGVTKKELMHDAEARGIKKRVEIRESPTDDDLAELIFRSAIYCSSSSYEGFGLAAIEAASAGLFPVLSDIPAYRDNFEKLGFGMLVDFDAPSTWSESYERFDSSFADFQRDFSGDKLRTRVAEFGWDGAAQLFDDVYARVLGRSTRRIGPVNVETLDRTAATAAILEKAAAGTPMMVTFCNAHTVNLACRNAELRESLKDATILNDGVGLDIASRALFGASFEDNLNGTDFVPHLLGQADEPLRVYFIGGAEGVAEAASQAVRGSFSSIEVAGLAHGYFDDEESEKIIQEVRKSHANLVLVAMGQPRQEIWASRHFHRIAGPTICVGALFDFLAGRVPRAPAWMRKYRIEWAYRLMNEPRRLARRYLVGNPMFLARIIWQKWFGRRI